MFKYIEDMGVETYQTLYQSYILPVANYATAVWGFTAFPKPQVLQNRVQWFYLGVHRFAPLLTTKSEMDWIDVVDTRWSEMLEKTSE